MTKFKILLKTACGVGVVAPAQITARSNEEATDQAKAMLKAMQSDGLLVGFKLMCVFEAL